MDYAFISALRYFIELDGQGPGLAAPEKAEATSKTPERSRKGIFSSSPKKEVQNRRQQEKEKVTVEEREKPTSNGAFDISRHRQRSMTLPSRRSHSLAVSDPGDTASLPRGKRNRSRNRQDLEPGRASPQPQPRSVGGLTSALQAGSRIVSSLRRKTSSSGIDENSSESPVPTKPVVQNNQAQDSSPVVHAKMSRQDGDGSDAADSQPDKTSTLKEPQT